MAGISRSSLMIEEHRMVLGSREISGYQAPRKLFPGRENQENALPSRYDQQLNALNKEKEFTRQSPSIRHRLALKNEEHQMILSSRGDLMNEKVNKTEQSAEETEEVEEEICRLRDAVNLVRQNTAERETRTMERLNSGVQLQREHSQEVRAMEEGYHHLRQKEALSTLRKIKKEGQKRAELRAPRTSVPKSERDPIRIFAENYCNDVIFHVREDLKLRPWKEHKIRQRNRRLFDPPHQRPSRPKLRQKPSNVLVLDDRGCMAGRLPKFSPSAPPTPPPEYISPFPKRGTGIRNGRTLRAHHTWHAGVDGSNGFGNQNSGLEWKQTWKSAQLLLDSRSNHRFLNQSTYHQTGDRTPDNSLDFATSQRGNQSCPALTPSRPSTKKRPRWNPRFFVVEEEDPIKPTNWADSEKQRAQDHVEDALSNLRRASFGLPSGSDLVNSEDYKTVSRISSRLSTSNPSDNRGNNYSGNEWSDSDAAPEDEIDDCKSTTSDMLTVEAKDFAQSLVRKASRTPSEFQLPKVSNSSSSIFQLALSIDKSLELPRILKKKSDEQNPHTLPLPDRLNLTYQQRLEIPQRRLDSPFA